MKSKSADDRLRFVMGLWVCLPQSWAYLYSMAIFTVHIIHIAFSLGKIKKKGNSNLSVIVITSFLFIMSYNVLKYCYNTGLFSCLCLGYESNTGQSGVMFIDILDQLLVFITEPIGVSHICKFICIEKKKRNKGIKE